MRAWIAVVAVIVLAVAGGAVAHEGHDHKDPGTKPRTAKVSMVGEFIDPQCYFVHDSRGEKHADCARTCAAGGQNMAFMDDRDGKVYALIAAAHGKNPNDAVLAHLGKLVQVKGVTFYRHGNTVLLVESIGPAPRAAARKGAPK